jgi:uncharacterized protein YutE (UPF0331/DUF86 family)
MLTGQDDVSLNKAAIIERALRRMKEEYAADPQLKNYTHIDALILNIERACQAAIDLAMHLVAKHRLGIPQNSAETFMLLFRAGIINEQTARDMVAMTGFRNVAIHEYQSLSMNVVHMIAREKWKSLVVFCKETGTLIQP